MILNLQLYCRIQNLVISIGDEQDLTSVPVNHPGFCYSDLLEEFDYWLGLQNHYLIRPWAAGTDHILTKCDYMIQTDSSSGQMGSHLTPFTDHNSCLNKVHVRVFRFTSSQSGWSIHRKVRLI